MPERVADLRSLERQIGCGRLADRRGARRDHAFEEGDHVVGFEVEVDRRAADATRGEGVLQVRVLLAEVDRGPADPQLGMRDPSRPADLAVDFDRAQHVAIPVDRRGSPLDHQVRNDAAQGHGSAKSTIRGAWSDGMPG